MIKVMTGFNLCLTDPLWVFFHQSFPILMSLCYHEYRWRLSTPTVTNSLYLVVKGFKRFLNTSIPFLYNDFFELYEQVNVAGGKICNLFIFYIFFIDL